MRRMPIAVSLLLTFGCAGHLDPAPALTQQPPALARFTLDTSGDRQALSVTRVAHSTVLLDFAGQVVLTDPWFSKTTGYDPGEPLGVPLEKLPHLAAVVASHAHYDHYDLKTFARCPDKTVPLIVKTGMGAAARKAGFTDVRELEPWQSTKVGALTITAAPAEHGVPENCDLIQGGGFTVFFGGDTQLMAALNQVAARFPHIDLALLPVNGLTVPVAGKLVMDPSDAAQLTKVLAPRVAIPIHYRYTAGAFRDAVFLHHHGTPEQFVAAVRKLAPGTKAIALDPGQTLSLIRGTALPTAGAH